MDVNKLDRVQELAQGWIVRLEAQESIKMALQEYTNKGSFKFRVDRLLDEGVVEERAVEMVLDEYAHHVYLESIE